MKKKCAKAVLKDTCDYQKVLHWYEKYGYNVYYYYLKLRIFLTRKPIPMNFVYVTNTQCTLRCKECHSYMPYFRQDMHYMANFKTFKSEIDKLLKSVDLIPSFRFQGGETLLSKDLAKMVSYACGKKQIQHIQIITNGTILPSEELINSMKNPKVLLSVSDYSCNEGLKNKLKVKEILRLCKENNVNAKHWLTKPGDLWIGRNAISNAYNMDKSLARENLTACHCFSSPKVIMFFKGKLYICPPAVFFAHLNPNFEILENEMADVFNDSKKALTSKIFNLAYGKYFYLCSRCNALQNVAVRQKPGVQIGDEVRCDCNK